MQTPLKRTRVSRKLTTYEVAESIGIAQSHYSRVENGDAGASAALARKIARFFGNAVTEHQILYPDDYAEPAKTEAAA